MAERSLSMREARGSIPRFSTSFCPQGPILIFTVKDIPDTVFIHTNVAPALNVQPWGTRSEN